MGETQRIGRSEIIAHAAIGPDFRRWAQCASGPEVGSIGVMYAQMGKIYGIYHTSRSTVPTRRLATA